MAQRRELLCRLLDIYGMALSARCRDVLEYYYADDLSLAEISENTGITRQGVHDAINKAQKQLQEYENKLGLLNRYQRLQKAVVDCRAALEKGTAESMEEAKKILSNIAEIER